MSGKHGKQGRKKTLVAVRGMHCANCEVLIERKLRKIPGVRRVRANHAAGKAEVMHSGHVDIRALHDAVHEDGYAVLPWREHTAAPRGANTGRDYLEIGAIFLVLVALVNVLRQFELLPQNFAVPNTIGYGLALLIGVVASMSTCIAVTGGLLVAVAAKYNAASPHLSGVQRFKPHLYFNAGRVLSYTVFGGLIGALGSTLTLSAEGNSLFILLASVVMIGLGLQMLNLLPKLGLLRLPKFIAHWIHDQSDRKTKGSAFVLGASTFFLPCGFTQGLQLYALAKGSAAIGALTMLAFSLGTLPALLSLSALSSFAAGGFQRYFLKFAGVAVVLLGILNIQSGLTLASTTQSGSQNSGSVQRPSEARVAAAPIVDGKQIAEMRIVGYSYEPHQFTVVQGMPVEWRIDARHAAGCGRIMIAPRAGVRRLMSGSDVTVISFTPQEPGEIRFNCGMGMMTRDSKFIVVAGPKKPVVRAPAADSRTVAANERPANP